MKNFLVNIKNSLKKVVLFASLFLALFAIGYYVINLLEIKSAPKKADNTGKTAEVRIDYDAELKKRVGSVIFAAENYDEAAARFGLTNANKGLDADPDKDGLPNYLEYVHGTNPLKADTDGDKFSDRQEITNGYDPDAPGDTKPAVEFTIAKMKVVAPMMWSQTDVEKDMLADLEKGLSHFMKTAAPGQNGNMIVSGHSSNYIWAKGDYNYIFKNLNDLVVGDLVQVKTTQKNGRVITYAYKISEKFVTQPDDEEIFADTSAPTLTLSTCWPLGTNFKRLIVKAELVK